MSSDNDEGDDLGGEDAEHEFWTREDEVRFADMNLQLRRQLVEMVKPMVHRTCNLENGYDTLVDMCKGFESRLNEASARFKETNERSDAIVCFKDQLDKFWRLYDDLDVRLTLFERRSNLRTDHLESELDLQRSTNSRLGRSIEATTTECSSLNRQLQEKQKQLEAAIQRNKEMMQDEAKRIDLAVRDVVETHKSFVDEVWGSVDCMDISPPSLRRFDKQIRKANLLMSEITSDISDLRRLETQVLTVSAKQVKHDEQFVVLSASTTNLESKQETLATNTAADIKRTSNLMAAFSANLMKESRVHFNDVIQSAKRLQQATEHSVEKAKADIAQLDGAFQASCKLTETTLQEVNRNMDELDERRKRDKHGTEEAMYILANRTDAVGDSTDALFVSLEHFASVVGMMLQNERMAVLLDMQDFRERTQTPYVGVMPLDGGVRKQHPRRNGIDLENLVRLHYQPQPLNFAGGTYERSQLMTLREKLVHTAQEALQRGPQKVALRDQHAHGPFTWVRSPGPEGQRRRSDEEHPRPPLPNRDADKSPLGVPRPGSRGQPSARGQTPPPTGGIDFDDARDRFPMGGGAEPERYVDRRLDSAGTTSADERGSSAGKGSGGRASTASTNHTGNRHKLLPTLDKLDSSTRAMTAR